MNTNEAVRRIKEMLQDPYGSGSIDAVKALFQALMHCGVGFTDNRKDRKSANFGCLDLGNHEALMTVLTDRNTIRELVRQFYYKFDESAYGEEE